MSISTCGVNRCDKHVPSPLLLLLLPLLCLLQRQPGAHSYEADRGGRQRLGGGLPHGGWWGGRVAGWWRWAGDRLMARWVAGWEAEGPARRSSRWAQPLPLLPPLLL